MVLALVWSLDHFIKIGGTLVCLHRWFEPRKDSITSLKLSRRTLKHPGNQSKT